MKKHSLFKFMSILLLVILVITQFLPGRTGEIARLPLWDVMTNYLQSYYYFFDTAVFMFVIGAFYGVLNKTGAYKKLLDSIVLKVKTKGKIFVFAIAIVLALLSSLTGLTIPLLIFIPFIVSIILLLGYDKLVAISSTVVSILIGFIGGIFVNFRDANSYYGYYASTFDKLCGIDRYTNLIPQIILLVLGLTLLILFINRHIKEVEKKKVKYDLNDNSELLVTEVKGNYKDIKSWPLVIIFSLIIILLILGLIPWSSLFEIELFNEFHTWLTELNIKGYPIFNGLISTVFPAFGVWAELGANMMSMVLLLTSLIIIKFIYRIKFDDLLNDMVEGAKKMLPTAMLMMMAYCVLVCTYNNGFIENLISKASEGGDINFVVASLISGIGSILHVDIYYTVLGVFTPIIGAVADESLYNVYAIAFQSLYGFVNTFGPTSLLLVFVLSYLDVPYTTWLKYIWRFVLSLFIIIFAILLIIALI